MRFWLRALILAAGFSALAAACWLAGPGLVCVAHQDGHLISTGQLMGRTTVGQVFECNRDNLSRVEVRMGTYGSWSDSKVEFGLVELDSLPQTARARFRPRDGAMIRLEEGWAMTTLLEPSAPGADGLELLVSRPPDADQGELIVGVAPREPLHLDLTLPLVFRRPLKELGAHHPIRFPIPKEFFRADRPLMVTVRLEGTRPGTYVGLHWRPFPAAHLPQIMDRPNRFWQAFMVEYLGLDQEHKGAVYPGWLIAGLTYPPSVPLEPLARSRTISAVRVSDNAYCPVSFQPLADSGNKTFHFFFRAPAATLNDALTLWTHRQAGPGGFLTRNGAPVDGALCFRAFASVSKREAMNLFTARLNEGKTGGWLSGWMIGTAVLIQVLIMAFMVSFLAGRERYRGE